MRAWVHCSIIGVLQLVIWAWVAGFLWQGAQSAAQSLELPPTETSPFPFHSATVPVTPKTHSSRASRSTSTSLSRVSSRQSVVISLLEQPDTSFSVPILLENKVMAMFSVDPNAHYTTITPQMAEALGFHITSQTPRVTFSTQHGLTQAPLVVLQNLQVGPIWITEVPALVYPWQSTLPADNPKSPLAIQGQLGLNCFSGLEVRMQEDQLVLSVPHPTPAESPNQGLFLGRTRQAVP